MDGGKPTWRVVWPILLLSAEARSLPRFLSVMISPLAARSFKVSIMGTTPRQPLPEMSFTDTTAIAGKTYRYRVIAVNTVGLKSE